MAATSGFQTNTTISAAFWRYNPGDNVGRKIMVEVTGLQFLEATPDNSKVWLYYAANNRSTTQEPYVLEGAAAQAFMADMEALFS